MADPVAVIVKLNGVPTVAAAAGVLLVMVGTTAAAATVIVIVVLPVPNAFVAPSTTARDPAVVGVPEMTPVVSDRFRPTGSELAE